MTPCRLYQLFEDSHGSEKGVRPPSFDQLAHLERMVWTRLADAVGKEQVEEITDAGG